MFKFFKRIKILFVILSIVIVILFVLFLLSRRHTYDKSELEYGVTFSKKQAIDLGLDWKQVFQAMFIELGIKKVRLSAYWDEVEPTNDMFHWEDIDWQIEEASRHDAEIILAIGGRLPRWPECHFPDWYGELTEEEKRIEILEYIEKTVNRYKDKKNIIDWQVENEPFLSQFGECPDLNKEVLDAEIALVKSLDNRPIVVTDSGELSIWVPAAKRANIFGTTMYRDTYSEVLKSYIHYPINPDFFKFKRNIASWFAHPKQWMVIEMQAEPWGPSPFQYLSQEERDKTMSIEKFKEMIEFSSKTGFKEFYLWGVEWWYWEMEEQDNPIFWEEAKVLFE